MTRTVEGVRDPLRVSADCENVVVGGALVPDGFGDTIYRVDDDGYARDDDGNLVPHTTRILATDVDPGTWGEQYHHPADCPEKDPPTYRPERSTCPDCTVASEREHDRSYYRPDPEPDMDVSLSDLQDAVDAFPSDSVRSVFVSPGMHAALKHEADSGESEAK